MREDRNKRIVREIFKNRFGRKKINFKKDVYVQEWLDRVKNRKYYVADPFTLRVWKKAENRR